MQACAEDGYISIAEGSTPISEGVKNVTNSFRKQATSDLNTVNTVMQYRAGSSYTALVNRIYDTAKETELHGVLGKHAFSVASGAESRQAAVRKCIQEFAEKGIPAFVDKSGREWSPEAYISMDIRTTVNNTANAAQDACCDRYGLDLFLVDSHMGARPLCTPYQGRLISRSNRSGIAHDGDGNEIPFIPLSSTSYGQAAGLFGINCGHHKLPFADGVNFQSYFPYDEKENAERYKEFQKQREMERKIRKTSREADMLKETGDEEGAKAARKRLAEQRKAYKEYSSSHGLKPHNDRTSVVKMAKGNDTFGDVYKDYGKTVDKAENSGIIKAKELLTSEKTIEKAKELANSPEYNSVRTFQELRAVTNSKIGYDGLPKVLDSDEFEEAAVGKTRLYRGVESSKDKTASQIADEFKNGKLWTGNSGGAVYGNGVYFTATKDIAQSDYAGNDGVLIEAVLDDTAAVADYSTIFEEYFNTGLLKPSANKEDYQLILGDIGQYAAVKGYDAIALNGYHNHDYVVLLNRTKAIVRK